MIAPDYSVITNLDITKRIFYHLSSYDLNNCALVNKAWHAAVRDAREHRTIHITTDVLKQINSSKSNLENYLKENYTYAPDVIVRGWLPPKQFVTEKTYDGLLKASLKARNLILRGRGSWLSCKCPVEGSSCGEQIDSIDKEDITNLETITVKPTFKISACALLDLVSRSPKLKILRFFGNLEKCDHTELFNLKRFLSDLDCLMWPVLQKSHVPTVATLVKRNENITTFYSTGELTCDLLAADALNNLKYLSLILNERWIDDNATDSDIKRFNKRAQRFINKVKCLGLGKNIQGLEVRTFNIPFNDPDDEPSNLKLKLDPLHEQYKLMFWEQVAKLPKLKYLSVHGAWELNEVCRELAKHDCKVEFLKIGLLPSSIQAAVDCQEDSPTLSMVDEARNLKKLPKLRSLWFTCVEKLGSIDEKTSLVLKDLMDLIWTIDIKVMFTEEVESLLNVIMRRGNQLGKTYKLLLHIQCKELDKANLLTGHILKFQLGADLKQKLSQIAESELSERNCSLEGFQIWGLQQIDNNRDKTSFELIKNGWLHYDGKFNLTSPWQNST